MAIILAQPQHISAALSLYTACMRAMRAGGIEQWDEGYPNLNVVTKDVRNGSLYILEESAVILGAICLNEEQHETYKTVEWQGAEPVQVVHRLCVDPARQRNGLATRLMDFAEDRARQNSYTSIRLDTYSGNPAAVKLYERRGYRKTGEVFFRERPLSLPFFCFEKLLEPPHARLAIDRG